MSSQNDPSGTSTTPPDTHWYSQTDAADRPPRELAISATRAVCEALVTLGRDAPAGEVRRLLKERGLDIDEATVERVRAQATPTCPEG